MTAYKSFSRIEVKSADKGEITAVFATIGVIDSDNDVTLPGAFESGAKVRISAYGHSSWQDKLPIGKATIREVGNEAIFEGRFFLDTPAGRDTFTVVKELAEDGLQEFSYGYDPVEFSHGEHDGQRVRFLKKLKVHEVSPVLLGAGVGTRVLTAKSVDAEIEREFLRFTAACAGIDILDVKAADREYARNVQRETARAQQLLRGHE